jgi:hypothetical protein
MLTGWIWRVNLLRPFDPEENPVLELGAASDIVLEIVDLANELHF